MTAGTKGGSFASRFRLESTRPNGGKAHAPRAQTLDGNLFSAKGAVSMLAWGIALGL
jgi:hypothetical protein